MHLAYFLVWMALIGVVKSQWLGDEREENEISETSNTNTAAGPSKVMVPSYITSVILNQLRESGKLSSNIKTKSHQSLGSKFDEKMSESKKVTSDNALKSEQQNKKVNSEFRHSGSKTKESPTGFEDQPKKSYNKDHSYESNSKESGSIKGSSSSSSSSNYEEQHMKKHPDSSDNIKQPSSDVKKLENSKFSRLTRNNKFYSNLVDDLILKRRSEESASSNLRPTRCTSTAKTRPAEEKSIKSETAATSLKKRFVRENLPGMFPRRLKRSDKSHAIRRQTSDKYAEHIAFRAKLGRDPSKLSSKSLMKLNKKLGIDSVNQS